MNARVFKYRGMRNGADVEDLVRAPSRHEALQRLSHDGVVVIDIEEASTAARGSGAKTLDASARILILRQLALMARAGVDLLDALETVASGLEGIAADRLRLTAQALRRGERVGEAFKNMPGFPGYVHALITVGEASGQLHSVLNDAAEQMAFEHRIRREVLTALTYPSFLMVAGAGAVGFLFYEVVPRFAEMIGDNRTNLSGLSALVIGAGEAFRANALVILAVIGAVLFAAAAALSTAQGRQRLYGAAMSVPVLNQMLAARERATWARIMAFALRSGVGLLEASDLASASAPEGGFRRGLATATRNIRAGKRVDEAFAEPNLLSNMDLSLLRAGQRTGALTDMFGFIAEKYEQDLRDSLKRVTSLIEPVSIGLVAFAVGAVAIGLVTAMSSVYDTVM